MKKYVVPNAIIQEFGFGDIITLSVPSGDAKFNDNANVLGDDFWN